MRETIRAREDVTLDDIVRSEGNISHLLTEAALATLGQVVVEEYAIDDASREPWKKKALAALDAAAQCVEEVDVNFPFEGASDVHYPALTVAALQFQARAYPAIVKGDEIVSVKVVGKDDQGVKAARAARVRDYMNAAYAYRMSSWEADTDAMLLQLPIIGNAFRKQWWDRARGQPASSFVPALRLVVSASARSLKDAPRHTEEIPDVYPYQIRRHMRSGFYREVVVMPQNANDDEAPRLLLEQHRLLDLDGDGVDEPYIVTVDHASREVLRVEPAFDEQDLETDAEGHLVGIRRRCLYRHYTFLPDPKGGFYALGFGHLLAQISAVIDTTINQMIDAGQAAIAGGGFVAAGVRFQGAGQSSWLEWRPGEYKVVDASAGALRDSVVERTFPQPSQIMMSLLDAMLAAARDIAAIKDVTSGEASNNGQVGTTLALIEQGLQVFMAIYKRIYRTLREEFQATFEDIGAFGDARTEVDYQTVLDDPAAALKTDFDGSDMDIRPVSDPSSVTRMQKMARAQFLWGLKGQGFNDHEINRRVLEAADIEDADRLLPPPPEGPDPMAMAALEKTQSETLRNTAQARKAGAEAAKVAAEIGLTMGEADATAAENATGGTDPGASDGGGLAALAGEPGHALDDGGPTGGLGAVPDDVAGALVGGGASGPDVVAGVAGAV